MSVVRTLVRRSLAPAAGLTVAVIGVWLALLAQRPGLNLWADLVTGISSSTVYTAAIAAGFAAFEANRWNPANARRLSVGVRSPAVPRLQHAAAMTLTMVAGYLLAIGTLAAYAAVTGTYGVPSGAWLVALGAAIVLSASAGYALGAVLSTRWFVAPAAALGFYAAFIFSRSAPSPFGVTALFPAITSMDSVFVRHLEATLLGQAATWAGLALLVLLASARGWRHRARRAAIALSIVAGLVVAGGASRVIAMEGQVTEGYNARDFVCRTDGSTLCLNAGYEVALVPLHDRVQFMNARVESTSLVAHELEQNVEGIGDDPAPGARSIYLEQYADEQDLSFALYRYVTKYGATEACLARSSSGPVFRSVAAIFYVDSWLSGYEESIEGLPEPHRLDNLRSMSEHEGAEWFSVHAEEYFSCALDVSDLP